ncbi:MAG: STAS domain-containing protein [Acidobacteria bacterium]|nr:STAS domain-containing protein [Acidobacteriota bacterium]
MGLEFRETEKYLIISIDGRLDSLNARDVLNTINEKLENQEKHILFNLENLEYISSAGLQVFLVCVQNRKAVSKKVFIYKPGEMVGDVIKISGFYQFLEKTDSME